MLDAQNQVDQATPHHKEVQQEDEGTDEEIQDEVIDEDELIDMAQIKRHMDPA